MASERWVLQQLGLLALALQQPQVARGGLAAGIHPQRHGRVQVGQLQVLLPLAGPILAQPLHPPGRVVPGAREVLLGLRHQGGAFAQEAPQHRVDERCRGGRALPSRGDRLVHQGVFGIGRAGVGPQQGDAGDQQRLHARRRGAGGQHLTHHVSASHPAHDVEGQGLHPGPGPGRHPCQHLGQRAPGAHGGHGVSALAQQPVQRG